MIKYVCKLTGPIIIEYGPIINTWEDIDEDIEDKVFGTLHYYLTIYLPQNRLEYNFVIPWKRYKYLV